MRTTTAIGFLLDPDLLLHRQPHRAAVQVNELKVVNVLKSKHFRGESDYHHFNQYMVTTQDHMDVITQVTFQEKLLLLILMGIYTYVKK